MNEDKSSEWKTVNGEQKRVWKRIGDVEFLFDSEDGFRNAYRLFVKSGDGYQCFGCRDCVDSEKYLKPKKRPKILHGITDRLNCQRRNIYVTINHDENGDMFELFIRHGKSGGDEFASANALGIMISEALRLGDDPKRIIEQLRGISGQNAVWHEGTLIKSMPDAVAYMMQKWIDERGKKRTENGEPKIEKAEVSPSDSGQAGMKAPAVVEKKDRTHSRRRIELPEEELRECISQKMTIKAMAKKFGCSRVTITRRLNDYSLLTAKDGDGFLEETDGVMKKKRGTKSIEIPDEELRKCFDKDETQAKMAKSLNISVPTLRRNLRRIGLRRGKGHRLGKEIQIPPEYVKAFLDREMNAQEIADNMKIKVSTVYYYFKTHNIKRERVKSQKSEVKSADSEAVMTTEGDDEDDGDEILADYEIQIKTDMEGKEAYPCGVLPKMDRCYKTWCQYFANCEVGGLYGKG